MDNTYLFCVALREDFWIGLIDAVRLFGLGWMGVTVQ